MSSARRYRVAVLGAGIGAQHVDAYRSLPDRFEPAVICDLEHSKAQAIAAKAPGCSASTDVDAVIADPSIDIIDICLPPHLHGPVALEALAAGRHVICEKPMATSVIEADRMVSAALAADRRLVPVFQYRYGRAFDVLAALIDNGIAGKPLVATLETHWNRGADYYAVDWRGTWARERGGAVLCHAIHSHDLAMRFVGDATNVSAMVDTRVNPIETEDCAAIAFATTSGALVTSSITLGAAADRSRLRFVFDGLTAESDHDAGADPYAPGQGEWTFTARDPAAQPAVDAVLAGARVAARREGFAGQFAALADALDGDDRAQVASVDGVRSIEFVAATYLSARSGRKVALPLDRSLPICESWLPD